MTRWTQILVDLPLPVSILLKITVVLAVGWTLHILLARRNPRWRALMWRAVIVAVGAIPLLVPLKYLRIPVASAWPPQSATASDAHIGRELTNIENSRSHPPAAAPLPPAEDLSISYPSVSISTWAEKHLWTVVFCGWLSVGLLMATHFLAAFVRIRKRIQSSLSAPQHLQQLLEKIADDLGCAQSVTLKYSSDFTAPFLAGFRRPLIVLPQRMTQPKYSAELPAIFAHELVHLGSRDLFWLFAARCIGVLMWFHPLVWKLRDALSTACEQVCDAVAADYVGSAESYCGTLARLTLEINGTFPIVAGIPIVRSCQIIRRLSILKRQIYSLPPAGYRVALSLVIGFAGLAALGGLNLVYVDNSGMSKTVIRTLRFPADRSLGRLMMQDATVEGNIDSFLYSEGDDSWQYLGEAVGNVSVPAGKRLWLTISNQSAWKDLSPLSKLEADDIYKLILSGSHEGGPKPNDTCMPHIAALAGLKTLDIGYSNVTSKGLQQLKKIKSLERLTIADPISNAGLAQIAELPSLKALYVPAVPNLKQNGLTDAGLRNIAKLTSLEELALSSERIGDAGLIHVAKLPSLQYLLLQGDRFTDAGVAHLKNTSSLKILHLGYLGKLTDVALADLSNLANLENLNLHWNENITNNGIAHLKKMQSLKKLDIGSSQVTDTGLAHLKEIKTLEYLVLPQKGITDEGLAHLGELTKLKYLHIPRGHYVNPSMDKDYYTDKGLEKLAGLRSLEALFIGSIGITDAGMSHIAGLANLKELLISDCPITENGLAKLTKLKSLEKLSLFYTSKITTSELSHVSTLPNITNLNVNQIEHGNSVLNIAGLPKLEQLSITLSPSSPSAFHDEDFACLANLKSLRWVALWPTKNTDAGAAYLKGLANIERINIGGPNLTDQGLRYLANMKSLNHLTITDGEFTDAGLRHLENLKALRYVNISSANAFSNAALQRFRNKLPNCQYFKVVP